MSKDYNIVPNTYTGFEQDKEAFFAVADDTFKAQDVQSIEKMKRAFAAFEGPYRVCLWTAAMQRYTVHDADGKAKPSPTLAFMNTHLAQLVLDIFGTEVGNHDKKAQLPSFCVPADKEK